MFIVDVEYEKLSLFCSTCKMINYYLSKYKRLQQDVKDISNEKQTSCIKI